MTRCEHRDDPDPEARPTTALVAEELFLLGVLRAWKAAQQPDADHGPSWRRIFVLAELPPEPGAAFDRFMTAVARTMRRPLDIRCRPCPQVGTDEEAMLRIVGALQVGDRLGAIDDLAGWLVPEGIIPALGAAQHLAAQLSHHGVVLSRTTLPPSTTWADLGQGARPH